MIHPMVIAAPEPVCRMHMREGEVFLIGEKGQAYHLQRNEWYQQNTYSPAVYVTGISSKVVSVSAGVYANYFLSSEGQVYYSSKQTPSKALPLPTKLRFTDISAADYCLGIC